MRSTPKGVLLKKGKPELAVHPVEPVSRHLRHVLQEVRAFMPLPVAGFHGAWSDFLKRLIIYLRTSKQTRRVVARTSPSHH